MYDVLEWLGYGRIRLLTGRDLSNTVCLSIHCQGVY